MTRGRKEALAWWATTEDLLLCCIGILCAEYYRLDCLGALLELDELLGQG